MAASKITYSDKSQTAPYNANKFNAQDATSLKLVINQHADALDALEAVKNQQATTLSSLSTTVNQHTDDLNNVKNTKADKDYVTQQLAAIPAPTVGIKTSSEFESYSPNQNVLTLVNKRTLYAGKKAIARKHPNPADFVFYTITDTHGDAKGVIKAVQLVNATGADMGAHLGDVMFNPAMKTAILTCKKPFLCVVGNHDAVEGGIAQPAQAKQVFVDDYQVINNVTVPGNAPYYYKDFPEKGVRVITLYEYEYVAVGGPDQSKSRYGVVYSQAQMDWFIATLKNTPADYHIVLFHHQPVAVNRPARVDKFTSSLAPLNYEFSSETEDPANITPEIIEAFRTGVNINNKTFFSGSPGINLTITTNFTAPSDKFVAHFGGHTHWDVVEYLPKYPKQLMVIQDQSWTLGTRYSYSDLEKVTGTDHEVTINRITLDLFEKTLTIDRIGARKTIDGKIRDFVTYPFVPDPVTVEDNNLTLNKSSISIFNNSTDNIVAYLNGAITTAVTYSSSDPTVATVNASGLVSTTGKAGSAIITVTSTAFGLTATVAVTNKANSFVLDKTTFSGFYNSSTQLTPKLNGVTATGVTYASSDNTIATVNSSGLVTTTNKAGTATITATHTATGLTSACVVTNNASVLTVGQASVNMNAQTTSQINAFLNGVATTGVTYASSNTGVATVNASGLITSTALAGSATITVTHTATGLTTTVAVTNAAAAETPAIVDRILADGGTLLYADTAARIAEDTALLKGTTPRLAFYGYKSNGAGDVVKLYALDSLYDCTTIGNIIVTAGKLTTKNTANPGTIRYNTDLQDLGLTKMYYKGNLVQYGNVNGVFVNNILPRFGISDTVYPCSTIFYQDNLIQLQRIAPNGSDPASGYVTGLAAPNFTDMYVEVEKSNTYVVAAEIAGVPAPKVSPTDYWSGNLAGFSQIKIYQTFDRVVAG